jgi:hypothetical protein
MPGAGNTRVNGTVLSTRPLVVRLPGNTQVTVTADPSTRVTRIIRGKLEDLKVGDTVRMMGQPDAEGNFTANRLDVGMDAMPGFGFGGGFGGGFGFGGPFPTPAQAPRPPGQF